MSSRVWWRRWHSRRVAASSKARDDLNGSRRIPYLRGAYAWRSLLATGVVIAGGSDFPVENPNVVALSDDVFTCDEARIAEIRPVLTLVDGKLVYRRTDQPNLPYSLGAAVEQASAGSGP